MALFLDVGPNDMLRINDTIVTVERKSGSRARLRILGPAEVELVKFDRLDNMQAAAEAAVNDAAAGRGRGS